jgi:integrase/recombinase XerD
LEGRRIYLDEFLGFLRDRGLEKVEDVTGGHLEAYRAWMLGHTSLWTGRKLSIGSVGQRLWLVKRFFAYWWERKVIVADPARGLTWPKVPANPPRNIPTIRQMEDILARPDIGTAFGLRDRTILEVLYATGLRREEIARLDVYDVQLAERTIHVRCGKGGKGRLVPLTESASGFLARYLKETRPELVRSRGPGRAGEREAALFVSIKGERFKKDRLGQLVGRYVRAVAPGTTLTCHAIRHAFATHMLQGGANPAYLQRMLGHAGLRMTERYTQVKPMDLKEAHRRHHPRGRKKGPAV